MPKLISMAIRRYMIQPPTLHLAKQPIVLDPAMLFLESVPLLFFLLGVYTLTFSFPFPLRKSLQIPTSAFFSLIPSWTSYLLGQNRGAPSPDSITLSPLYMVFLFWHASPRFTTTFWLVCCSYYSMKSRRAEVGFHSSVCPQSLPPCLANNNAPQLFAEWVNT